MQLIITGASGFVGRYFIKCINNFEIKEVDLLVQRVEEIDFKEVNCVLHLAALVHQMKGAPEEQYFKINRDLALEVARYQGIKQFVFHEHRQSVWRIDNWKTCMERKFGVSSGRCLRK